MSPLSSHHVRALIEDGTPPLLAQALAASPTRMALTAALREACYNGLLLPGSLLPSERRLLLATGLNRTTIRTVFDDLVEEGLIHVGGVRERRTVADFGQAAVPRHAVLALGPTGAMHQPPGTRRGDEGDLHLETVAAARAIGLPLTEVTIATLLGLRPTHLQGLSLRGLLAAGPVLAVPGVRPLLLRLAADGLPVVVAGGTLAGLNIDSIESDHAAGAAALVRLLDAAGCRVQQRLWHVAAEGRPPWFLRRNHGHETALLRLGRTVRAPMHLPLFPHGHGPEATEHAIRCTLGHLYDLDPAVDAIHAISDPRAWVVAEAWLRLGRDPDHLRCVGYDRHSARLIPGSWRPWATVEKDNRDLAIRAVARLSERLAGAAARSRPILIAPRVVQGAG